MLDSVLKGTGNSRFLKSAVPAGTSWADALAMLQAGTFPIDFNGINAEGFQQVGTPLNKANLLKDATAAQIGLPPSTTPDGMFQALGNTGELHVWRKTVTNQQAGYNLGEPTKNYITSGNTTSAAVVSFSISDYVSVDDFGNVTQDSASTSGPYTIEDRFVSLLQGRFRGKFVKAITAAGYDSNNVVNDGIWYIPVDAIVSCVRNGTSLGYPYNYCFVIDKMQAVSGHGAGTTTTYPVSTNPNAYQEGSDAKPAGYTLGEVVTGLFKMGPTNSSTGYYYGIANSITVNDDGTIPDLTNTFKVSKNISSSELKSAIAGKFVQLLSYEGTGNSGPGAYPFKTIPGPIVFIPADVNCGISDYRHYIDRYKPVTGYSAIPAGTTIEYLGKLGDKARVQVVSYVGTGTYGSSNPNSLTFDFVPKFFAIMRDAQNSDRHTFAIRGAKYINYANSGGSDWFNYLTWEGKKVSWYSYNDNAANQFNASGNTYYVLAIG